MSEKSLPPAVVETVRLSAPHPEADAEFDGGVVAFAGDWHGAAPFGRVRVMTAGKQGIRVIFHVGDFGIWPGPYGKKYLLDLEKACDRYDVTIMVTPGNHEDWNRILGKKPEDRGDGWGPVLWMTDHIAVLPRGHRFTLTTPAGNTRTFVSLGGAPSIDFETRTEGRDWWPEEMITPADVATTVEGGRADVMIAHDSPDVPFAVFGVEQILKSNPMGWSATALAYATMGRERMHQAYLGVAPTFFFHGHYHVAGMKLIQDEGSDAERWVVSLDQQHTAGNIARLDLDALTLV